MDGATTPIRRSRRGERAPKYGSGSTGKAFVPWVGADEGGPKEEEGKMYKEDLETLGPVSSISTASIRVWVIGRTVLGVRVVFWLAGNMARMWVLVTVRVFQS